MLLAFCFLFICIIDPTQICLSPISLELLQLFQGIVCNNERVKGGKLETWIIGGVNELLTPLYIMTPLGTRPGLRTQLCYEAPCDLQIKHRQNILINFKKKTFMAPFYRCSSTASRLESLRRGSLLFTTKFPEIPGTHFIDLGGMNGWVNLGATQWFWIRDPWIGNPAL